MRIIKLNITKQIAKKITFIISSIQTFWLAVGRLYINAQSIVFVEKEKFAWIFSSVVINRLISVSSACRRYSSGVRNMNRNFSGLVISVRNVVIVIESSISLIIGRRFFGVAKYIVSVVFGRSNIMIGKKSDMNIFAVSLSVQKRLMLSWKIVFVALVNLLIWNQAMVFSI